MEFGPLELQACGENNFTMKALDLLAFRKQLLRRFIGRALVPNVTTDEITSPSILFFSRIGEGFMREAVQRIRRGELNAAAFEHRLNMAVGLPVDFRWSRNTNGQLTQPAKWGRGHIEQMCTANGRTDDAPVRQMLEMLQDCLNTEPDIVVQWGDHLALVEIKVLSSEGINQMKRQQMLGKLMAEVLGWQCHFAFIGPEHGPRPSSRAVRFISWGDIAALFADVEEIASYINQFVFFYDGDWRSMVQSHVAAPATTAFDIFAESLASTDRLAAPAANHAGFFPRPHSRMSSRDAGTLGSMDAPGFAPLGRDYFRDIVEICRREHFWPLETVYTGMTGGALYQRRVSPELDGAQSKRRNAYSRPGGASPGNLQPQQGATVVIR